MIRHTQCLLFLQQRRKSRYCRRFEKGQQQSFTLLPLRCTTEINPGAIFRLTRRWSARRSATCPLVPLLAAKSLLASQKLYPIPTPTLPSENNRCNRHRGRG